MAELLLTLQVPGCSECGRAVVARGLCSLHYQRAKKSGSLPPRISEQDRYWQRVDRRGPDECWPWLGYISDKGYGQRWAGPAHRSGWEYANGPIPEGLTVDHLCRQTWCQNPSHMELVTVSENVLRAKAPGGLCRNGHDDWGYESNGRRRCRTCRKASR